MKHITQGTVHLPQKTEFRNFETYDVSLYAVKLSWNYLDWLTYAMQLFLNYNYNRENKIICDARGIKGKKAINT